MLNKKISESWITELDKFRLEKSINWELAIIKKINKFSVEIETEKKLEGIISYENVSWAKKELNELFKTGDIVYYDNTGTSITGLAENTKYFIWFSTKNIKHIERRTVFYMILFPKT